MTPFSVDEILVWCDPDLSDILPAEEANFRGPVGSDKACVVFPKRGGQSVVQMAHLSRIATE